jgi:hypothetical protein
MKIKSIVFAPLSGYPDMYLRPMKIDLTTKNLTDLDELVNSRFQLNPLDTANITSGSFSFQPVDICQEPVKIPGGWGSKRYAFIMEVVVHEDSRKKVISILRGYTDNDSVLNGTIDPELRLFFNTQSMSTELLHLAPQEEAVMVGSVDSTQILQRMDNPTYVLRPEDTITLMNTPNMFGDLGEKYLDLRTCFSNDNRLKKSRIDNTRPATWLSNILKALKESSDLANDTWSNHHTDILADARSILREPLLFNDIVFEELNKNTSIMENGYIKWGELTAMCPDIDGSAIVVERGDDDTVKESAPWNSDSVETTIALKIANTIQGYMLDSSCSSIDITMSYDGDTGLSELQLNSIIRNHTVEGTSVLLFNTNVNRHLFPNILPSLYTDLVVRITSSVGLDTTIEVSVDGKEAEKYVYPSFADGLLSPLLFDSKAQVDAIVNDIELLFRVITKH